MPKSIKIAAVICTIACSFALFAGCAPVPAPPTSVELGTGQVSFENTDEFVISGATADTVEVRSPDKGAMITCTLYTDGRNSADRASEYAHNFMDADIVDVSVNGTDWLLVEPMNGSFAAFADLGEGRTLLVNGMYIEFEDAEGFFQALDIK